MLTSRYAIFRLEQSKAGQWSLFLMNKWLFLILLLLLSRLRAGCDQTHHLPRGTQVWRSGRGHHSYCIEGCAWRPGVPAQEWTDPQVTAHLLKNVKEITKSYFYLFVPSDGKGRKLIHVFSAQRNPKFTAHKWRVVFIVLDSWLYWWNGIFTS